MLKDAELDANVAVQAYKTFVAAAAVKTLIASSTLEFDTLAKLKTPDLIPLDDAELLQQFVDLSAQIQGS